MYDRLVMVRVYGGARGGGCGARATLTALSLATSGGRARTPRSAPPRPRRVRAMPSLRQQTYVHTSSYFFLFLKCRT